MVKSLWFVNKIFTAVLKKKNRRYICYISLGAAFARFKRYNRDFPKKSDFQSGVGSWVVMLPGIMEHCINRFYPSTEITPN